MPLHFEDDLDDHSCMEYGVTKNNNHFVKTEIKIRCSSDLLPIAAIAKTQQAAIARLKAILNFSRDAGIMRDDDMRDVA